MKNPKLETWREFGFKKKPAPWVTESVLRRYWKRVIRKKGDCWGWVGARAVRGGYGQMNVLGKTMKAHRISFTIHNGEIPNRLSVLHKCNNPICSNPAHLYLGTQKENWDDMVRAGRAVQAIPPRGEKCHLAKLTTEEVLQIRSSSDDPTTLSKRFHTSRDNIYRIKNRKTWKHV